VLHAELEHVDRTFGIGPQIGNRIGKCADDRNLPRDMTDRIEAFGEDRLHVFGAGNVAEHEFHALRDVFAPAVKFVVEHDHAMPLAQQAPAEMDADKAGAARNQNPHASSSLRPARAAGRLYFFM
jgi:hypothetical protein